MRSRPVLLDLFCGAGGAGMGYSLAGFDVVGVDISPQSNYPFEFHQGDALEFLAKHGRGFDAIHASPPCQRFSAYRRKNPSTIGATYPNLIPDTRNLLKTTGSPYLIENVPGSPLVSPVQLCGSSFGLDVRRHRLFETSFPAVPTSCDHGWQTPRFPPATNRTNLRSTVEVGVWRIPIDIQRRAMGVGWMSVPELSQAIPPAYTEYLGRQLASRLTTRGEHNAA